MAEKELDAPKGKTKNIQSGGNIMDDSFFDSLSDIDDGLGIDFSKLGEDTHESINDLVDSGIKLTPTAAKKKKITSATLPTAKLPKQKVTNSKETGMSGTKKIMGSVLASEDDPHAEQLNNIWKEMNTSSLTEYKLMVMRLEPQMIKGTKINGYLDTFHLPTTIPDIIENVGQKYGGGKYQLRIVDGTGKYVKSKTFEISGLPKIPREVPEEDPIQIAQPEPVAPTPAISAPTVSDDDDDDDGWDDDDSFDPTPRRPLRPSGFSSPFPSPYGGGSFPPPHGFSPPYGQSSFRRDPQDEVKGELRGLEDKITNKLDSKLGKLTDTISLMANSMNKKPESFLNAEVITAVAPVIVNWLDNKSNRDSASAGQFSSMNKEMVGLMQGMQDLVRITDKSKEDHSEKERKDRELNRREMLDYQSKMEERFLQQQRMAQEQHQAMLTQMRETLEGKHRESSDTEHRLRLEYDKMREEMRVREEQARRESREKEEKARIETREREEKLREEQRRRDEEARRSEREHRERMVQEERQFREQMRLRDEELRRKEMEWKDEMRLKEMEINEKMRGMDTQRTGVEHKLLEQIYNNNYGTRESQLQMEMAIAKMTSDSESKMLQTQAQMELEKIRHGTAMQMSKMKHELSNLESKKGEDPFDSAIKEYLQRKLQIDMVNDLNFKVEDDDDSGGMMGALKKILTDGGPLLAQILGMGGGGGMRQQIPAPPQPAQRRVVNPTPATPAPSVVPQPKQKVEEEEYEVEEEIYEEETQEDDYEENLDDFYGIDPMQEIPRVADFFQYVKLAIESGEVTPAQAAEEAKVRLSVPIVAFLQEEGQSSEVVVGQLFPLLQTMFDEEFCSFFMQAPTIEWMDKMLAVMANPEAVEPTKEPEPEPVAEAPAEKPKAKKPAAKKPAAKKKAPAKEAKVEAEPKKPRKRAKKTTTTKEK